MISKFIEFLSDLFSKTIVIIILLVLWEIAPRLEWVDPMYLPPFSEVITSFFSLIITGSLFVHIFASLQRSLSGLLLAVAVGIPLGFLVGWFKKVEKLLDPILNLFRNTSTLALFPVFIIFFGLSEVSKIAIIFWGTLWPTLLNTISGVRSVDPILIKSARSMGISNLGLFAKVILPAATPSILTGFRLSAAGSVLILVAAEMLGANKGLGFFIFYSEQKYDVAAMYAGIITISMLGLLINYLIGILEKNVTKWKQQVAE